MDSIKCHSAIPLAPMLFGIWIQVSVLADLIQDVIELLVYLLLCCKILNLLCTLLIVHYIFVWE